MDIERAATGSRASQYAYHATAGAPLRVKSRSGASRSHKTHQSRVQSASVRSGCAPLSHAQKLDAFIVK